jgi:GNAT superfamily N-acetyltransferase
MNKHTYKIVQAQVDDLSDILSLVQDLAIYEKEPDAITTDLNEYKKCFEEGIFEAILAKKEENTIGMALYYTTFSTWKGCMIYLEDFIVKEPFRQSGVGAMIFDRLLTISKEKDAKLVKWQVLDWNTPAVKFYEKNGAVIEKNWWNGKILF